MGMWRFMEMLLSENASMKKGTTHPLIFSKDTGGLENMAHKETAKQVIDSLPNDVSMDEIIHALYVNIKFSHGEQEIREGKGISQVEAKKKLEKWLK
jgi:hypothetical protein